MASRLLKDRRYCSITVQKITVGGGGRSIAEIVDNWDEFYRRMSAALRRMAAAMNLPEDTADDVVQEVWLATVANWPRFRGKDVEQRLGGWMLQVMHNKIVDALKDLGRRPGSLDALRLKPMSPDGGGIDGERRAWIEERLEETAADESLNGRLLRGRFRDGRTNAELAAENDLTEKAVERRICKMIAGLRQDASEVSLLETSEEDAPAGEKPGKS